LQRFRYSRQAVLMVTWSPRGRDHTTLPTLLTGAATMGELVFTAGPITGTRATITIGGAVPDIGTTDRGTLAGIAAVRRPGEVAQAAPRGGGAAPQVGEAGRAHTMALTVAREAGAADNLAQSAQ
jgi:hypothetical protein